MRVASAASAAKTIAMIVAGMDCGRVNINAGDRTAFELPGGRRRQGQRATRRSRPIKPGRKTLGGDFSILRIEKCAEDDDLAGEFAMKKIRVVAFNAGEQIGERKRLNIVAATLEIESQCVWHRTRNEIAGERHASVFAHLWFGVERARCQLERHRRHSLSVSRERQRHSPHHFVGVRIYVERPDILLLTYRDPLSR